MKIYSSLICLIAIIQLKVYSNDIPVDVHTMLDNISITYGELKNLVSTKYSDLDSIMNMNFQGISDDTPLVRVGYHGTLDEFTGPIIAEGLKSSPIGLFGPRVYSTPNLEIGIFYAMWSTIRKSFVTDGRLRGMRFDQKMESVCSLFMPVSVAQKLRVKVLTEAESKKVHAFVGDDDDDVTFPFQGVTMAITDKLGNLEQVNFPFRSDEAQKSIIPVCESVPIHRSFYKWSLKMWILGLRFALKSFPFARAVVRDFDMNSALRGVEIVDFAMWGRLTEGLGDDSEELPTLGEKTCVFCHKVALDNEVGNGDNNDVMVFEDKNPGAHVHILAIPRSHDWENVVNLSKKDVPMLKRLKQGCVNYFESNGIDTAEAIYGFHMAPFYSVPHLHLHCLIPPLKVEQAYRYIEGAASFISYETVLDRLERGYIMKARTQVSVGIDFAKYLELPPFCTIDYYDDGNTLTSRVTSYILSADMVKHEWTFSDQSELRIGFERDFSRKNNC